MAAEKRHVVAATMVVVKVPGAQGGEVYLRKGQLLPATVEASERKRLTGLGLVTEVKAAAPAVVTPSDPPPAPPAPPAPPVEKPAPNAGPEKWAAYAASLGIEVPADADKARVRDLVEAHEAAGAQQ